MKIVLFQYKNWRGISSVRRVVPIKIWFGSTEWHQSNQWLLQARDVDRDEIRDFAMADISDCRDSFSVHVE